MKKCILLVRVSTERQTLDAQRNELIAYASQFGYKREDMELIEDKESAIKLTEEERNGLNRLKECIETGDFDCVFVWEISRIARKRKVLYSITEYLTDKKIQLRVYKPAINLLDDQTKEPDYIASLAFSMYAELAEAEMRNKLDRFKRAKREGFEKGKYQGGKYTLGYTVNEDGYWVIDEDTAPLVRLIFQLYNSGEYSMTSLAKELKSRGYFPNVSITSAKAEMHHLLKNPIYVGQRTSNNIYPAIIDKETWDACVKRRSDNKHRPKNPQQYLLTPLIHCICGASYSVNALDGTYNCRVKHNAVEKGLKHSPDILANVIESLAWFVALQELSADMASGRTEARDKFEKDIVVYKEKAAQADREIKDIQKRRNDLDERYFVAGTINQEQYNALTTKQDEKIRQARETLRVCARSILELKTKIDASITFDSMLNDIAQKFEDLKNGTEFSLMRTIVHRYITDIHIEAIPGKGTSWWKRVIIHTTREDENKKQMDMLRSQGFDDIARTLAYDFTVDCYHHIVYYDKEATDIVPYVYLERVPRLKVDKRKGRKRLKTKQHQY